MVGTPGWATGGSRRTVATLAALLLGTGLTLLLAGLGSPAHAEEVERANCPPGFVWIRMSGTGCVQEKLPENGKIGYDGHALCIEPYVGIYEARATTDGQPAPGSPYTSFSYLKRCVTKDQYDRAIEREREKESEASGGLPSTVRTGAAGLAVVSGLVALGGAAVLVNRHRRPTPDEIAARDRNLQRQQQLQTALADATALRDRLRDSLSQIRDRLGTGAWGLEGLNNIAGILTSLISLGGSVPVGIASLLSTGGGELASLTAEDIDRRLNETLESLERQAGAAEAEVDALTRDLAEGDRADPNRLSAESYTDYDVLQGQIDRVNDEIRSLLDQRNTHELAHGQIQLELDDIDIKLTDIQNQLWEVQYGAIEHNALGHTANAASLMAGLVALGPFGASVVGGAGLVSALGSATGFTEYLIGRDVSEVQRLLASATQGYQRLRGQLLYRLEDEARRQANAQTLLDQARAYHDRLREQQAQISLRTKRGVLWPKR